MNKKNSLKLFNDFPKLYQGRNEPLTKNLMGFGFECGDGWFDLIYKLSKDISEIDPDCVALQVKEKFGGLRFYTGPSKLDEVFDLIEKAEQESFTICECCGSKENVKTEGYSWIVTLCNNCKKKNDNSEGDLVRNLSNIDCNPDNLEKLFGEDK